MDLTKETWHWYPGHMKKARRELEELIKYLDLLIEVRDARIPETSHNRDLDFLLRRRPVVLVLNKADLAEPRVTAEWQDWFPAQGLEVVLAVNGQTGRGLEPIWERMGDILAAKKRSSAFRVGVVGIPNVGKSSILNRLIGGGPAKTGNKPGITRGKQWVRRNGFEVLDTPGLLPPRIENPVTGMKLALTGALKEELVPVYDLALWILEHFGARLTIEWETKSGLPVSPEEKLTGLALRRGFLQKGGIPDLERAAVTLLRDFRNGRLGLISLEDPPGAKSG